MNFKIKVPQELEAKFMLWTDISFHDMEVIDNIHSIPDLESALCNVFGVDLPEPKRAVLLELYVQTVLFCRQHSLKKEQTSALLSIIKSIHEANIETPLCNIEQCLNYSKELLFCHSVRRPPFSIDIFSFQEVECILKYIHSNYLRHYKLYKYIFTPQVTLDLSLTYSGMPDHGSPVLEDSSVPDVENATEEQAAPNIDTSFITEHEEASTASTSELKALIEQEVRQQLKLASGQLDQTIREKEKAFQLNGALNSSQPNLQAKKEKDGKKMK
ncbi:cilia- and flagella-associated protein 119 [Leuresthes tenuis]|uniref:cilia- and flagella-associated protein 119 n=1 Tax=Leuresthes tenuis TaxID=355514 RepID=UPI003B500319